MADQTKQVKLSELGLRASTGGDTTVTGLSVDSRDVKQGHLFAALPGARMHGAEFISFALRMGAAAVLTDREGQQIAKDALEQAEIPVVLAEDPRQALAYAAALWFERQPEVVVAVTGTNGKTSVATFLRQIWELIGHRAANIGTTGVEGTVEMPSPHTTPEPITLHRMLSELAQAQVNHVVMEASSHGLAQRRLDGVHLSAAGFTNITQDHLDYHADFDDYFRAKLGLFDRVLPEDGVAVLNDADQKASFIRAVAEDRHLDVLNIGMRDSSDLRILSRRYDASGQDLRFDWQGQAVQVRLGLIGGFQAENVLMAVGLAIATGSVPTHVFDVLPKLKPVKGRMQHVATRKNGATVFVDYAHTPDAVETALKALRPHVLGRIIAVIGAGGDRDQTKRPLMGQAAAAHADVVIVTDDNPRSEDPEAIRRMVMAGCPDATEVGDRAEAILRGVDVLGPGDALLIAGKGHETGQVIGDSVFPFDDSEQASVAVAALDGLMA